MIRAHHKHRKLVLRPLTRIGNSTSRYWNRFAFVRRMWRDKTFLRDKSLSKVRSQLWSTLMCHLICGKCASPLNCHKDSPQFSVDCRHSRLVQMRHWTCETWQYLSAQSPGQLSQAWTNCLDSLWKGCATWQSQQRFNSDQALWALQRMLSF